MTEFFKNYLEREIDVLEAQGGGSGFPGPAVYVDSFATVEYNGAPFTLPQFILFDTFDGLSSIATANDTGGGVLDGLTVVADGWYTAFVEVDFGGADPFLFDTILQPSIKISSVGFNFTQSMGTIFYPAGTDLNNKYILDSVGPFPAVANSLVQINLGAALSTHTETYALLTLRKIG